MRKADQELKPKRKRVAVKIQPPLIGPLKEGGYCPDSEIEGAPFELWRKANFIRSNRPAFWVITEIPHEVNCYYEWEKIALQTAPSSQSNLCTNTEYICIMMWLIDALVKKGESIRDAWWAVTVDARKLIEFRNKHIDDPELQDVLKVIEILCNGKLKYLRDETAGYGFWTAGTTGKIEFGSSLSHMNQDLDGSRKIENIEGLLVLKKEPALE